MWLVKLIVIYYSGKLHLDPYKCSILLPMMHTLWVDVISQLFVAALFGRPALHPTNLISIKLKIWSKFTVLWFKIWSTDHNEILHTSRQCYCGDLCKLLLWSVEYIMNKSMTKLHWIWNLMEISLVGRIHGRPGGSCYMQQNFIKQEIAGDAARRLRLVIASI